MNVHHSGGDLTKLNKCAVDRANVKARLPFQSKALWGDENALSIMNIMTAWTGSAVI